MPWPKRYAAATTWVATTVTETRLRGPRVPTYTANTQKRKTAANVSAEKPLNIAGSPHSRGRHFHARRRYYSVLWRRCHPPTWQAPARRWTREKVLRKPMG